MLTVHEQVALISSSQSNTRLLKKKKKKNYLTCVPLLHLQLLPAMCKQQALLKLKDIQYIIFQHLDALYTLPVFSYIFLFSHHKKLKSDLKGIIFVMLAVHEQVALMSFSQRETRLLLYLLKQFAMSLHLFVFHCTYVMYTTYIVYIYYIYTIIMYNDI